MWDIPSVVTPPKSRTPHRFLLPAASVMDHGAHALNSSSDVSPTIYPYRHIYVDEGASIVLQDGTPAAPFTSLEEVLEDEALQEVCKALSRDYIHIHLRQHSTAVLDGEKEQCVFKGPAKADFCGHLVIEPWPQDDMAEISVSMTGVIKLPSLSEKDQVKEYETAREKRELNKFYNRRHNWSGPEAFSCVVFRSFRGVFFHRIKVRFSGRLCYEGYEEDQFGNNTPYSPTSVPKLIANAFYACTGCGLYQCNTVMTSSVDLDFPDPWDAYLAYPKETGEHQDTPGKEWGHIDPPESTGSDFPDMGSGEIGPKSGGGDIKGGYSEGEFWLVSYGISSQMAWLYNCDDFRTAENAVKITSSTRGSGVTSAAAMGRYSCSGGYSRKDAAELSASTYAREYVYTQKNTDVEGNTTEYSQSVYYGASGVAQAVFDALTESSTILRGDSSTTASASVKRNEKVDTEEPYYTTLALAAGRYAGSQNKVNGYSSSHSACASSPWNDFCREVSKESISGEELQGARIYG
jgi:hypothetical protein